MGGSSLGETVNSPAAGPCAAAEHRQFDFWIGAWEVFFAGTDRLAGHNRIEPVHGGCALAESWRGVSGFVGNSLSYYEAASGLWRQLWRDSAGTTLDLSGGFAGGRMRMFAVTREPGAAPVYNRITWTPLAGGEVRHLWETSRDWGESWSPDYDLLYRRA
jgi:hypothetical protein